MKMPTGVRRWFRLPRRESDIEREIDEELEFHISSRIDDLVARGVSREAARAQALSEFGDVAAARVELSGYAQRHYQHRRRAEWWFDAGADLKLALRSLKQRPGFAIALALTLGIGLGANLVTFDFADRLLFRSPEHVVEAERVTRLYFKQTMPVFGELVSAQTTWRDFSDIRAQSRSFADVAAYYQGSAAMGRGESAERIQHGVASASLFSVLGVRPYLGRFYTDAEDSPPHGVPVAVLDYDFWQRRYGGSREALGKQLLIGKASYTIVGVAPRGFTGADLRRVDVWTPATVTAESWLGDDFSTSRDLVWLRVVARLKPGVTEAQAQQELTGLWKRIGPRDVQADGTAQVLLAPIQEARGPADTRIGRSARVAKWLSGVSVLVLLVACANAANLILARTIRNRRDIGIRMALGVGRARLLRQYFVEGAVFVVMACVAALLFARWGSSLLQSLLLQELGGARGISNTRVFVFLGLAAAFTLFATLIPPSIQMLRESVVPALKSGARDGQPRSRLRTTLLFLQAALSVVLLVGAAMFVRSLHNASRFDLGFDRSRVVIASVDLHLLDYEPPRMRAFYEQALERVGRIDGVESAAIGSTVPMESSIATEFRAEGRDSVPIPKTGGPYFVNVTPAYFRTMGTRIVQGREFTDADRKGTQPVAILGETMARLIWPDESALGKCVYIGGDDDKPPCTTVVGIAQDVRSRGINRDDVMQYYIPLAQEQTLNSMFTLFVRAKDEPDRLIAPITREIHSMQSNLPYVNVRRLQTVVEPDLEAWRLGATLFTVFGMIALLLAAVGLYSMLSWMVASRTHEMGLRMALGASPLQVVKLVMNDGLKVAIAGVLAGIAVAVGASRYVGPMLFDVSPHEPLSYAIGGVVLITVAVLAALIPARRATSVEPAVTLRAD